MSSDWRQEVAPQLAAEGRVVRVLQLAGEMLFIPRGWRSVMTPISDAVTVTEDTGGCPLVTHPITPLHELH